MFIKLFYYPLGVVAILGIIMSVGLVSTATAATTVATTETATETTPYSKEEVINSINEARQAEGLSPLTYNLKLTVAAQSKADDMVARGYFSHDTPDGVKFWKALNTLGYNYQLAGENLAVHYDSVDSLVDAWLNSPSHRYNIMTAGFTETGIGLAYGDNQGYEGWFVVQIFGHEF